MAATLSPAADRTVCNNGCDFTTIQGAINATNPGDTIRLLFTAPHNENDIVINKNITLIGLGPANTIVQAAANPNMASSRVFFIDTGLAVQFQDLTIRHGNANSNGGGIYNDGSDLTLINVLIRQNQAPDGGGIYNDGGKLRLSHVSVNNNTSFKSGGGIYNTGELTMDNSAAGSNQSIISGGGIHNTGQATLYRTSVANNKLLGSGPTANGGGIYNLGKLLLMSSSVDNNSIADLPMATSGGGGGIYSLSAEATLIDSIIQGNKTGDYTIGAGLKLESNATVINNSFIAFNKAETVLSNVGGIYGLAGTLTINHSIIHQNEGSFGGGFSLSDIDFQINNSVIDSNKSSFGGGLYLCGSEDTVNFTNVTISGNEATTDGGGLYLCTVAFASLANVTISANRADSDDDDGGDGGGIYLQSAGANKATARIQNTLIAGNIDDTVFPTINAGDCFGELSSLGYNLIGSLGFNLVGDPCSIAGSSTGNLVEVMPKLDPLADNGGATLTHALRPDSPAINAGHPSGCIDFDHNFLLEDQRGGLRINRCDIGAFELNALVEKAHMPILIRP